jgi:hypothetical protein
MRQAEKPKHEGSPKRDWGRTPSASPDPPPWVSGDGDGSRELPVAIRAWLLPPAFLSVCPVMLYAAESWQCDPSEGGATALAPTGFAPVWPCDASWSSPQEKDEPSRRGERAHPADRQRWKASRWRPSWHPLRGGGGGCFHSKEPCKFYFNKTRGCKDGEWCAYCHLCPFVRARPHPLKTWAELPDYQYSA